MPSSRWSARSKTFPNGGLSRTRTANHHDPMMYQLDLIELQYLGHPDLIQDQMSSFSFRPRSQLAIRLSLLLHIGYQGKLQALYDSSSQRPGGQVLAR